MVDDKIAYLKGLYDEETDRQKVVEAKCGQLISNSGIFLSLIGLLITLLFNAKDAIDRYSKFGLVLFITAIIALYIYSVVNALKSIDPYKYNYSRGNPITVHQFTDVQKFKEQLVSDYLSSIDTNHKINSQKLELLAKARTAFVTGIYLTGVVTFLLVCYFGFFYLNPTPKPQKIEIVSSRSQADLKILIKELSKLQQKAIGVRDLHQVILFADSLKKKDRHK